MSELITLEEATALDSEMNAATVYQHIVKYVDYGIENMYNLRDRQMFHDFIFNTTGFNVPTQQVCEGHCAPFDFVYDSFFDTESMFLVVANRNGGKTQNFGILNAMDALCKPGCEVASVGAIEDQATKCYKYTTDIFNKPHFKKYLKDKPRIGQTTLLNKSEVAILPGTMAGVNGPHPQKTNFDEVELTQWRILQEFLSMAKSSKTVPATIRITSTRKFAYGPMQKLIDEKDERGFKMYIWCIWETIERCSDDRSGTFPCTVLVQTKKDKFDSVQVFSNRSEDMGKIFSSSHLRTNREKYTGCLACPLVEVCQTKAKRANGFYSIQDTINKFTSMDRETWDNQWECKRPGTQGLVYTEFDESVHVIPQSKFVFNPHYKTISAVDPGYEDPAASPFIQFLPNGDAIIFDEVYERHKQSPVYLRNYYMPKHNLYKPEGCFVDPENADVFSQVEDEGVNALVPNKNILGGLESVRKWLKTSDGHTRLYITSNCVNTIREFKSYRYPQLGGNKPVDRDNHLMDCIRYILHNVDDIGNYSENVEVEIW